MTEKECLRYDLLKATRYNVDEARACYNFIKENENPVVEPAVATKPNGIYVIYTDGHAEPFTGSNSKEGVQYIGVAFEGKSFAVALQDIENVVLLPEDGEAGDRERMRRECDAIYDYNSFGNTAALCEDNPNLRSILGENMAIPALGILNIMAHFKQEINEALAYVGGAKFTDTWYWSSTEYYQFFAWYVNFSNGFTSGTYKSFAYAVRAVAAF